MKKSNLRKIVDMLLLPNSAANSFMFTIFWTLIINIIFTVETGTNPLEKFLIQEQNMGYGLASIVVIGAIMLFYLLVFGFSLLVRKIRKED